MAGVGLKVRMMLVVCAVSLASWAATPSKLVGIGYATWFPVPYDMTNLAPGASRWSTPLNGPYVSTDTSRIANHATTLSAAGIDFIAIDWTNNIECQHNDPNALCNNVRPDLSGIETATATVFQTFSGLTTKPRIIIMLGAWSETGGCDAVSNGKLQRKLDQVYTSFVQPFPRLYQTYRGKPLVIVYMPPHACFTGGNPPAIADHRFTARWMTGWLSSEGPEYVDPQTTESLRDYWSWWDREPLSWSKADTIPESITVSAAYQGMISADASGWGRPGGRGRQNGRTYSDGWSRALNVDPQIVLINSWNEWIRNHWVWIAS